MPVSSLETSLTCNADPGMRLQSFPAHKPIKRRRLMGESCEKEEDRAKGRKDRGRDEMTSDKCEGLEIARTSL